MANLTESSVYESGVYQLERSDPVDAGVGGDGVSNLQAKQLANRTKWLKEQVDSINGAYSKQPPAFSTGKAYTAGDVVSHQKNLWRANTTIPAGAFNSGQWTKILGTAAELDYTTVGGQLVQAPDAAAGRSALGVYSIAQVDALVADESLINAIIFG